MSNTLGTIFRVTTFGESHGAAIGGIIDGCPAGVRINTDFIQQQLNRRKPGQSAITTQRNEGDEIKILSGVFEGISIGTPISFVIENKDQKSKDYDQIKNVYRPSHADYTYEVKYGIRDYRGGGRSSARATASVVAAGAVARLYLEQESKKQKPIECIAYVNAIGGIRADVNYSVLKRDEVEKNIVRCPDDKAAEKMLKAIEAVREEGNSLGGIISCVIRNVPAGLGEPLFNKLQAALAYSMFSINAVHGFEYGGGFEATTKKGSEVNDEFMVENGKIKTATNHSGGVQGGISNGMDIYFNVAFKSTATIMQTQRSVNTKGEEVDFKAEGRHDPCVLPRAVPIVEAMAYLVMADMVLLNKVSKSPT